MWSTVWPEPAQRYTNGRPLNRAHLLRYGGVMGAEVAAEEEEQAQQDQQQGRLGIGGVSLALSYNSLPADLLACFAPSFADGEMDGEAEGLVTLVIEAESTREGTVIPAGCSELDDDFAAMASGMDLSEGVSVGVVEATSLSVRAPRALLSARNSTLGAMLASNMSEALSGRITLRCHYSGDGEGRPPVFLSLVVFLLTDILAVRPEDVLDLLLIANQYQFSQLVRQCEFLLCRQLDATNVLQLFPYADSLGMATLRRCCLTVLARDYAMLKEQGQLEGDLCTEVEELRSGSSCLYPAAATAV